MKNNWSEKMLKGFLILKKIDPNFRKILNQYGLPEDRSMPNNYDTLVKIIIGQQISRSAAKSIYSKLSKNEELEIMYNTIGQGADNSGGFYNSYYWSSKP